MSRQDINGVFTLEIPENLQPVSAEELQEFSRGGDPFQWAVRDTERHVMITALWKQYSGLISWLADMKAMAKKNQQMVSKVYEGNDYRLTGYISMEAGDLPAEGYRFTYTAEGIAHSAAVMLIKEGRTVYSITCAGREENAAADCAMFREVLESLELL